MKTVATTWYPIKSDGLYPVSRLSVEDIGQSELSWLAGGEGMPGGATILQNNLSGSWIKHTCHMIQDSILYVYLRENKV